MNPALAALIARREASLDAAIAARAEHGFGSRQFSACIRLVDLYRVLICAAQRAIEEEV